MAGNSVPAFFGGKARQRKPSGVDVTITYDHSASNNAYIAAFRNIANIRELETAMAEESVGTGTVKNRYSMTSFEFLMHTLHNNVAKVWIDAADLSSANLEWADSRNVAKNGSNDEDETGAIYNLLTASRSVKTLVTTPATNWPRTRNSWTTATALTGPVIDGSYRALPTNTIRTIIISQSTEESGADSAIAGTYGIANGAPGSEYNLDDIGPSDSADNNTKTAELSNLLTASNGPILVFLDSVTITCTETASHQAAGLIPSTGNYLPVGAVFPSSTAATLIYAPGGVINAKANVRFVPNVPLTTLSGLGPDAAGTASKTNTYHYAKKSGGAVLSLDASQTNFATTFWALGKVLGKYLYEVSF